MRISWVVAAVAGLLLVAGCTSDGDASAAADEAADRRAAQRLLDAASKDFRDAGTVSFELVNDLSLFLGQDGVSSDSVYGEGEVDVERRYSDVTLTMPNLFDEELVWEFRTVITPAEVFMQLADDEVEQPWYRAEGDDLAVVTEDLGLSGYAATPSGAHPLVDLLEDPRGVRSVGTSGEKVLAEVPLGAAMAVASTSFASWPDVTVPRDATTVATFTIRDGRYTAVAFYFDHLVEGGEEADLALRELMEGYEAPRPAVLEELGSSQVSLTLRVGADVAPFRPERAHRFEPFVLTGLAEEPTSTPPRVPPAPRPSDGAGQDDV